MIEIGAVYRIRMYPSDGITPEKPKFIIIVGYDNDGFYGAVVTNTNDHPLIPIEFQYPIRIKGYRCYVNCRKLYQISSSRLDERLYIGNISDEDIELIIRCVQDSDIISVNDLIRFGIIEKNKEIKIIKFL